MTLTIAHNKNIIFKNFEQKHIVKNKSIPLIVQHMNINQENIFQLKTA
jgi:hypothetical protein